MLEHVPHWLGRLLHNVRAGHSRLVIVQEGVVTSDDRLDLSSIAFADGARLPERFTADGEGVSPPLAWSGVPDGTAALALVVEDPDAPAPNPLVHAVVWNMLPTQGGLDEGAIAADGRGGADGSDVGRNSYMQEGWLPPDPPTGHGSHDYVFQLFALSEALPMDINPGRRDVLEAIRGKVLAAGMLVGTYSRGEEVPLAPRGAAQIAERMAAPQRRQPPLMLGLAGLMPQIACVLIALGDDEVRHAAIVAGGLYAAMILSFLGGMWWMQALSRSDARWWPYALAVVPSLVGWASLTPWLTGLAAPRPALVVLGVALLASPAGDRAIGSFGCDVPPWRRLRQLLSGGLGSLTIILSALPGAA